MNVVEDLRSYELKIKTTDNVNILQSINTRLIKDFDRFKRNKDVQHCIMRRGQYSGNTVLVTWVIIQSYDTKLVAVDRLERDLAKLNVDGDQANIGEIIQNDKGCTVHFELIREYRIEFVP